MLTLSPSVLSPPRHSCDSGATCCLSTEKPMSFTARTWRASLSSIKLCQGEIPKQTCNRLKWVLKTALPAYSLVYYLKPTLLYCFQDSSQHLRAAICTCNRAELPCPAQPPRWSLKLIPQRQQLECQLIICKDEVSLHHPFSLINTLVMKPWALSTLFTSTVAAE